LTYGMCLYFFFNFHPVWGSFKTSSTVYMMCLLLHRIPFMSKVKILQRKQQTPLLWHLLINTPSLPNYKMFCFPRYIAFVTYLNIVYI
jgi:hypothetical protein